MAAGVLHQMNERLAAENASLLAELARFRSGKHPLLHKAGGGPATMDKVQSRA